MTETRRAGLSEGGNKVGLAMAITTMVALALLAMLLLVLFL